MSKYLTRIYIGFSLLFITPAGFLLKHYTGPGQWWFNDHGAGVLYEIFWIQVIFFFSPKKQSAIKIPLWVFTITSALEILQLWNPLVLTKIRSFYFGRVLIGTTFSWWDFPHYAVGCVIGWIWIIWLIKEKNDVTNHN